MAGAVLDDGVARPQVDLDAVVELEPHLTVEDHLEVDRRRRVHAGCVRLHVPGQPRERCLELGECAFEVVDPLTSPRSSRWHGEQPEAEATDRREVGVVRLLARIREATWRHRPTGGGTRHRARAGRIPSTSVSLATTALPSASCPVTTRRTRMGGDRTLRARRQRFSGRFTLENELDRDSKPVFAPPLGVGDGGEAREEEVAEGGEVVDVFGPQAGLGAEQCCSLPCRPAGGHVEPLDVVH